MLNKRYVVTFMLLLSSTYVDACDDIYRRGFLPKNRIKVTPEKFDSLNKSLVDNLSGNPANTNRTEWKAQGPYSDGKKMLFKIFDIFGDDKIADLKNIQGEGREFFENLIEELAKGDLGRVSLRNESSPPGLEKNTFTYYMNPITDDSGAIHQVRIRRFINIINPSEIKVNSPITSYGTNGRIIQIGRLDDSQFYIVHTDRINRETGEFESVKRNTLFKTLTLDELKEEFGERPMFYAYPHSQLYRLEVKTIPRDNVSLAGFDNLNGKNYVQKSAVKISDYVFGKVVKASRMTPELREMIISRVRSSKHLPKGTKLNEERADSVLNVVDLALKRINDGSPLQRASQYRRWAFEFELPDFIGRKQVSIQMTIDYDMYLRDVHNEGGKVVNPLQAISELGKSTLTDEGSQIHIELKVPKVLIERMQEDPSSVSSDLKELLSVYSSFNVTNEGKYLRISTRE